MNVGDKVRVDIQGEQVAQAEVKEVGDGTVTVIIPATRVVMAMKSELDVAAGPDTDNSGTETIVDEVVRTPEAPANASGDSTQPSNTTTQADSTTVVEDASKVITSSSVPGENDAAGDKAKFDALDPAVQAQINEIVAAHLAARAEAENDATQE